MDKVHLIEECDEIKINCFWLVILCPEGAGRASCGAGCSDVVLHSCGVVPASLFQEFDRLTCKPDHF